MSSQRDTPGYIPLASDVSASLLVFFIFLLIGQVFLGVNWPLDLDAFAVLLAATFLGLFLWQYRAPASDGTERTLISRTQVGLCLGGLLLVGALLRLYALGSPSFWFDEAITTTAALGLLERGTPGFPSGVEYRRGLPHTLIVAASMVLFGVSEWAARLPSVVQGVATILVTYWLGREVGDRRVGLLAAILVTFLTWEIAWGRQARMYQQLQLCYALALLGLARMDRTGPIDPPSVSLVVAGTAVGALTHPIGLILIPVAGTYLLVQAWTTHGIRSPLTALIVGGTVVGAVVLELLATGPLTAAQTALATDIVHVNRYRSWVRAEFPALSLLALVGMGLSFRRPKLGLLLALALLPPLWVLAYNTYLFAGRYLYFAVPIAAIYVGFVGSFLTDRLLDVIEPVRESATGASMTRLPWSTATNFVATVVPILVVLLLVSANLTVVPQAEYELGPNAPQPDFKGAYAYVDELSEPDDVIVAGWTAPAVYYHGHVDYWMVHNLTSADRTWTIDGRYEVYSGAVPIENASRLESAIGCHERGWIVVDRIVWQRIGPEARDVLDTLTNHDVDATGMRVYSWEHEASCDRADLATVPNATPTAI